MRIALVTEFFHPSIGGTQTVVACVAGELAERGHEVTVIAPLSSAWPRPVKQRSGPGRPDTTLPGGGKNGDGTQAHGNERFRVLLVGVPRARSAGYAWVQHGVWRRLGSDLDVIHIFHPAFGLAGLVARRTRRPRLVVSLMGYDTYDFASMVRAKKFVTRAVCRGADVVTAPSRSLSRAARDTGVRRAITYIPHGVSHQAADPAQVAALRRRLGIEPGTTTFVAVQRLYPVKDPATLLEAWRYLGRPDCHLILVGGGELEQAMRQRTSQLALANVRLMGEVQRHEVPNYLALGDAFVHHSRYESFGLGVLEAMEAGLPVVASDVGALPEIITNRVDGLLIPPSDPQALAAAVAQLADSPGLRSQLAAAAHTRAQDFAWPAIVDQYERIYREG